MRNVVIRCVDSRIWFYLFLALFLCVLVLHVWIGISLGAEQWSQSLLMAWMAFVYLALVYVTCRLVRWVVKKVLT